MRRAFELAERGRGAVEPNPLVGAVLVRDGRIVGEGWHEKFGHAHAEINALAQAGELARGATCYVTLEPCCHHGKTPPCTEALIKAGIARVVAAMPDPFPEVAGQGAAQLRAADIAVEVGLCESEARRQNAPYLMLVNRGRPWVHAKWAMTLDGKIATKTGESKWISNEAARRRVHELRGRMDAVVVGIGTVLADDPLLTARPPGPRTPFRMVLDSLGRLPLSSRLVQTARETPTLVAASTAASEAALGLLHSAGCEVLTLTPERDGRPSVPALLSWMGQKRWTNLLVEGGAQALGAFLDAALIDEAHVFVAPKLFGGAAAPSPIGGQGRATLVDAWQGIDWQVENLDGDAYLHGLSTQSLRKCQRDSNPISNRAPL
ncbi:MAG: bifunctional diaminohydroxyphosphoribosylaminopyrimidine deaminase/5-amino-6-(5-phosphoribosylamino)uracil reductase RibD [Planctomycetes bacterium]|nr:bifunctional diaminohydroxyphosphoribosylaminopyrimidine deaminase/5-amino-6-(5-phosphoribosylamino)uracil reductase RibD [Planctomycetota bacterium]